MSRFSKCEISNLMNVFLSRCWDQLWRMWLQKEHKCASASSSFAFVIPAIITIIINCIIIIILKSERNKTCTNMLHTSHNTIVNNVDSTSEGKYLKRHHHHLLLWPTALTSNKWSYNHHHWHMTLICILSLHQHNRTPVCINRFTNLFVYYQNIFESSEINVYLSEKSTWNGINVHLLSKFMWSKINVYLLDKSIWNNNLSDIPCKLLQYGWKIVQTKSVTSLIFSFHSLSIIFIIIIQSQSSGCKSPPPSPSVNKYHCQR